LYANPKNDPPYENSQWSKGPKKQFHQIVKYRTEASFCPILIIERALESWNSVEFKKILYVIFFLRAFCTQNSWNMWVSNFDLILCLVGAHKIRLIFLNFMGSQLSNAFSMITIGQKLAPVCLFKPCTRIQKMTPLTKNSQWSKGPKKNFYPILKYRTETSFCPILIIERALESWGSVEFNTICHFFLACILHAEWSKHEGYQFWMYFVPGGCT